MDILIIIFIGIIGLVLGSFINVLIYRVPKEYSIVKPRSKCLSCNNSINWYDNIPVISYIILNGRCRYCKSRISFLYPLVETITSILFILIYVYNSININFFIMIILTFFLLVISFTDIVTATDKDNFQTGVIPVIYLIIGLTVGLIKNIYEGSVIEGLAGFGGGYLLLFLPSYIYSMIRGIDGIGDGDILLLGMIGLYFGIDSVLPILVISSVIGLVSGLIIIAFIKDRYYPIPFAPMLSFGSIVYMFNKDICEILLSFT